MSFRNEDREFSPSNRVLPRFERSVLSGLLSTSSFVLSEQNLLRVFSWETKKLTHLLEDDESFDVFQVIRIPRVIGVSEFNRQWSVLMAVDHLCLVLEDCRKAILALSEGVEPKGEIDLSLYAPRPDLGFDVLDRFENLTSRFCSEIQAAVEINSTLWTTARFSHPCFGSLTAKQWLAFATMHQMIHRRQVQKIIVMLGIS